MSCLQSGPYGCTRDTEGQMSQRASPQEEHLRWRSCGSLHTHALKQLVQRSVLHSSHPNTWILI